MCSRREATSASAAARASRSRLTISTARRTFCSSAWNSSALIPELMVEELIISMSIDVADVDSPEGNGVESIWMRGFSGLNVGDGGGCDFHGVARFLCGFFVVNLWWIDGGLWLLVWWRENARRFLDLFFA